MKPNNSTLFYINFIYTYYLSISMLFHTNDRYNIYYHQIILNFSKFNELLFDDHILCKETREVML